MGSIELMRVALAGLEPELIARIRSLAEKIIREFDGSPDQVPEFQEAQRVLQALDGL